MNDPDPLVNRDNFLTIREFLDYLLNVKNRNKKSVERYRFWLRLLLLWAMGRSFEMADRIKPPFHNMSTIWTLPRKAKRRSLKPRAPSSSGRNFITAGNLHSCPPTGSKI